MVTAVSTQNTYSVILADLISQCARLHAEGRPDSIPELWSSAAKAIAG